ncbi:MAG: Uncharacterized protein Athens101428_431 [Candidatus Berkelbacteria bacterium Athens1014_28]|uniref:Uncharacterized protein n=1 Tax=Candidatus Berkelbacteria bacterium Athens1014_28 TaxID=2017145 RepID=A0A554LMQ2_9BACT|nr:MAG: Uncharacterized protein Athens101428_431 [Candidatus Berkelbacteria bacterium Athens1014_28]
MKKKIRTIGIMAAEIIFSAGAWISLHRAVSNPGVWDWTAPGIFFSLVFVFILISVILLKERWYLAALLFFSLVPSLFFAFNFWHLLALAISFVFLFWASVRVDGEMKTAVKINLWRSVRLGRMMIVFGLALAISSQYYFEIQKNDTQRKIPRINIGSGGGEVVSRMVSFFYPGMDISNNQDLTVDQFILQSQQDSADDGISSQIEVGEIIDNQFGDSITIQQRQDMINNYQKQSQAFSENNNELILKEGRKQISSLVGAEVTGDEKVSDIFSQMINKKIEDFINLNISSPENEKLSYLPVILAILLFLSILSVGSFVGPIWVLFAQVIFWMMVKFGWVEIKKIATEQEIVD